MPLVGKLYDLLVPSLEELKSKISPDLSSAYEKVNCEIVDCPDFTKEPFLLSGKGICGKPVIADVGGIANLLPLPRLTEKFDMTEIVTSCDLPNAFVCGAGAGPFYEFNVNCEIVADIEYENFKIHNNKSMVAKVDGEKNISSIAKSSNFSLLGQFICTEGKTGKVLKISVERRIKDGSIVSFIQQSLAKHYGHENNAVGLGGIILAEKGDFKIHVMPGFCETPLDSMAKVNEWLKFFTVSAPFVAMGEMVSHDPFGLDLRLEHFHGFTTDRKQAGHFHYDITPENVKYTAYFTVGERLLRQYQPVK